MICWAKPEPFAYGCLHRIKGTDVEVFSAPKQGDYFVAIKGKKTGRDYSNLTAAKKAAIALKEVTK